DADRLGCAIVMGKKEFKLTWQNLDRYRRSAWLDYNRSQEQLRRLVNQRLDEADRQRRQQREEEEMASFCTTEETAVAASASAATATTTNTTAREETTTTTTATAPKLPPPTQMGSFRTEDPKPRQAAAPEPQPDLAIAA
ncbi:MAG: hypothetical protein SGI92_15605, partial [Bryobacteraceae bacterium]|nr:hypothetical protein [Bryobacteraceae bacterium]